MPGKQKIKTETQNEKNMIAVEKIKNEIAKQYCSRPKRLLDKDLDWLKGGLLQSLANWNRFTGMIGEEAKLQQIEDLVEKNRVNYVHKQ